MTDWREEARARCEAARSGSVSYRLNLAMWKDLPRALAELEAKDAEIARLRGLLERCVGAIDAMGRATIGPYPEHWDCADVAAALLGLSEAHKDLQSALAGEAGPVVAYDVHLGDGRMARVPVVPECICAAHEYADGECVHCAGVEPGGPPTPGTPDLFAVVIDALNDIGDDDMRSDAWLEGFGAAIDAVRVMAREADHD